MPTAQAALERMNKMFRILVQNEKAKDPVYPGVPLSRQDLLEKQTEDGNAPAIHEEDDEGWVLGSGDWVLGPGFSGPGSWCRTLIQKK